MVEEQIVSVFQLTDTAPCFCRWKPSEGKLGDVIITAWNTSRTRGGLDLRSISPSWRFPCGTDPRSISPRIASASRNFKCHKR